MTCWEVCRFSCRADPPAPLGWGAERVCERVLRALGVSASDRTPGGSAFVDRFQFVAVHHPRLSASRISIALSTRARRVSGRLAE